MFKPLIVVILALILVLGGMEKPAYAYSHVKEGIREVITNEFVQPAIEETVNILTGVANVWVLILLLHQCSPRLVSYYPIVLVWEEQLPEVLEKHLLDKS